MNLKDFGCILFLLNNFFGGGDVFEGFSMGFPGNCKALLGIKVQKYYSMKKAYIVNENVQFYIVYSIIHICIYIFSMYVLFNIHLN